MKIAVATFTYAPNVDGVAQAAKHMVNALDAAGHLVKVVTSQVEHLEAIHAMDAPGITRFNITGAPALGVGFEGEISAYQEFLLTFNPDVIIFHGWDTWPVQVALPVLPRMKSKSILLSHGYSAHLLEIKYLPRGLLKWFRWLPHVFQLPWQIRAFDKVIFLSQKSDWNRFFDVKIAQLTGARNITTIPNGVPELPKSPPKKFRRLHGIGQGTLFLCIANYSIRKNQERALRAFAEASMPDATLVFIGSELGDYGRRVVDLWKEIKKQRKSGQVLFLEGLDRMETIAALRECDVKVLAADAETQPIVLLEAMASSKPFITTNTGCVEEFKGGLIVRNAGEMARAMKRLAASPEECRKLGEEGRRDYEQNYSLKRTSKAWLELLDGLINPPQS